MAEGFVKYQHIERLGTDDTLGINIGEVWVFPKIDGTNSQLWWTVEDGVGRLHAGSRKRELSYPDDDNQGFFKWCIEDMGAVFAYFFRLNSHCKLFGEWLVPHTLKTYRDDAWRRFYVFDVFNTIENRYLPYLEYKELLTSYGIDYIPPICSIENPTLDRLMDCVQKNTFLIKDGEGIGEGIVIKNYDYRNKYGRVIWAKIVTNEFKDKHWGGDPTYVKEKKIVEVQIVDKYVTEHFIEKEFAKIKNEAGWNSKMIPRLLNTIYHALVAEESWSFVKEHKNPTIDFSFLYQLTIRKIKQVKPELF